MPNLDNEKHVGISFVEDDGDLVATVDTQDVAWDDVTGKPSTFPFVIGTGADEALAGNGTAVAATKLATSRAITLTGDVTGTANFDGTATASITAATGSGVIVNADVNASAAIAATKIAVAADAVNGITADDLQAALSE